jgi:hypothetical protein
MEEKFYVFEDGKKHEAKGEELAYYESWIQEMRLIEAEQTAKAEAKASAMAKLAALGLSEEEVQAIIGA